MRRLLLFISFFIACITLNAQVTVKQLLCEYLSNPIGIDAERPRFAWQLHSDQRNVTQSAYEIVVSSAENPTPSKGKNVIWRTGKVLSGQSVHVPYGGPALQPGKRYYWQVRIWDQQGKAAAWSEPAYWEMGLLQPGDWKASWIAPGYKEDETMRPSPVFRKAFAAKKKVRSARAYITARGIFEAFINGKRVGDAYLTPGWTSYNKRLQYMVFDITSLLRQGENALGVQLGNGWYRGFLAWGNQHNIYGRELALLLQVHITYTDGTTDTIITDNSWKSSTGPIRYSEIYHGEINDSRLEKQGWTEPGYADGDWSGVNVVEYPKNNLLATWNEPIRKKERFAAQKIFRTPRGELVADFGQNLVGMVQLTVSGKSGDSVKIYHAEVLDKNGNFYTENLRIAKQQNIYVLNGKGVQQFEPHFTFQGFRYIKVEGFPGELKPENITAIAMYSDMPVTGTFESSHPLVNQLQHNIQWGQKGNFLDVPTDCPQRDERLGWTGDAQVFSRTAAFNMHVHNFFAKWLRDLEADQQESGAVPFVIPQVLRPHEAGATGWADAATIIPWNMYLAYGDTGILQRQYSSMKRWVEFMRRNSTNDLWNKGFHFGDWLFYRPADDNDGRAAVTDKYLIAQCFYAHSLQLLANTAAILGNKADVETYTGVLQRVKDAFVKEYVTPSGRLVSGTQTAYVLALQFDMLPPSLRQQAADRLVENIKSYNYHLTTGFLGTPYLCHVLTKYGYSDIAYRLLLQETYPSWLYPVKMGATTIWERWDGMKPDGSFQTPAMNSFNHYAYGAIGDWMYRAIAGIDTEESAPGYRKIRIKPHVREGLTKAAASLDTYYGAIYSGWEMKEGKGTFEVHIPCNTTATIYIPAKSENSIRESGVALSSAKDLKITGKEGEWIVVEAGSGRYKFVVE